MFTTNTNVTVVPLTEQSTSSIRNRKSLTRQGSAPSEPESYTSEEYRCWVVGRRSSKGEMDASARLFNPSADGAPTEYGRPKRRGRSISGIHELFPGESIPQFSGGKKISLLKKPVKQQGALTSSTSQDTAGLKHQSSVKRAIPKPDRRLHGQPTTSVVSAARQIPKVTVDGVDISRFRKKQTAEKESIDIASLLKREIPLNRKPLKIKPEEFRLHGAFAQNSDETGGGAGTKGHQHGKRDKKVLDGLLYVHVYCGHGLKASRMILRDLYCVLSVDAANKARTAIRTGAINFDWDEDFEMELDSARRVSFSIYSWDPVAKQKLCFSTSLLLQEFLQMHGVRQRLALRLDPTGILYVELSYKDLSIRFQRTFISAEDAIFGADLEALVGREQTGDKIPIVVRRCIEDIERRGIEGVGLYRLCGSYKRQNQMKTDLERDVNTDISARVIPDISVITGNWI